MSRSKRNSIAFHSIVPCLSRALWDGHHFDVVKLHLECWIFFFPNLIHVSVKLHSVCTYIHFILLKVITVQNINSLNRLSLMQVTCIYGKLLVMTPNQYLGLVNPISTGISVSIFCKKNKQFKDGCLQNDKKRC